MRAFDVVLVQPPGNPHTSCFQPVAELVHHGLLQLGHDSAIVVNGPRAPDRRQIVIGPLLDPGLVPLGDDAIFYQLEQVGSPWFSPAHVDLLRRHTVWDGSARNAAALAREHDVHAVHVPLGHVEELVRIPRALEDVDVLFYGSMNDRRARVLGQLAAVGLTCQTLFGVYGRELDSWIARAKLVLNVHFYEAKYLQTMRLTYLLSNGRCVVSEDSAHPDEDAEFADAVDFCCYEDVVAHCFAMIGQPMARAQMGAAGQALMRAQPEAEILRVALEHSDKAYGLPRWSGRLPEIQATRARELEQVAGRELDRIGLTTPARPPLLCLTMIVKDEAAGIRATLASVRSAIDTWCILDTGSTDGTQTLIREALAGVPGELHEQPFIAVAGLDGVIDFAATRNRCLDLAGARAAFTLMLSGDEVVHGADELRAFCVAHQDDPTGAHYVRVRQWGTEYDRLRLSRAGSAWRYVEPTHEVLVAPPGAVPGPRVPGVTVDHLDGTGDQSHRDACLERDRRVLELVLADRPGDTRSMYLLAQTLEYLGQHLAAITLYVRRIAFGGWQEEVYAARYHLARCAQTAAYPWEVVQQLYLDAHAGRPCRAEPLVRIAAHWLEAKQPALAYLFAQRAAAIPYPEAERTQVARHDYEVAAPELLAAAAWELGELAVGEEALCRCLRARPDDENLRRNLELFEERAAVERTGRA